ncbi:hypothetical protein N7520_001004 [Penicillium odoratum]|uniref:uncharacterized protein n=1 Tax=Penicillium odoratum TaxID=1167516 RepID=UPI002546A2FD|nr:uncharacterized protein N7520_001004 [Penicillium odoratum]KAJ5777758.1 hypothetical protein N7520_001004 [Penicillium odoratum]
MPTDIATRAYVVALKANGKTTAEVSEPTNISIRTINYIYARACERGFDPNLRPAAICDAYVADAPRSGRPTKQTPETEQKVLSKVRFDHFYRYGREKICAGIPSGLSSEGNDISAMTIWRIFRKAGLRKTKPTRKPGLTQRMRNKRLSWCLAHQHWELEHWKNVI